MPYPKKPRALKLISGSRQPDTEPVQPVIPIVAKTPAPPDWLINAHAVKEWERLAPILTVNHLLSEASLSTLGHLCNLHGELVRLSSAGMSATGHLLAQYRGLANDFGVGGMCRIEPGKGEDDGKGNQFDGIGRKPT